MGRFICTLLVVGLHALSYGQNVPNTTQQPPSTKEPNPFPNTERGLIITTFHALGDEDAAQIRHLPIFPAFENFSGSVPGIGFTNPNIHFLSIDVDYREKKIFAFDFHLRSIAVGYGYNKDLNVSKMDFDFMHVGVSRGTIQVAYDWLSKTLYWSDYVYRWIVAAATDKEKIEKDYYTIIADKHLDGPDGIAVDPILSYLFWSDNGRNPKIERSNTNGSDRHTIVTRSLISPVTMECDIVGKRIYWIERSSEAILSATYDGEDVILIQRIPTGDLLDLAIFRDVVYVSDISNSQVYSLNTTKGLHLGKSESTDITIYPEIIYGLAVYSNETQPVKDRDYCAEKNCEHLCVSTKTGAECMCSVGFEFNKTTEKCDDKGKGFHKAIVIANVTHICLIDIRSFANLAYDPVCKFSVIKQNLPTTTIGTPPAAKRRKRQAASTVKPTTKAAELTRTIIPTTTTPAPTAAPGDMIKMIELDAERRVIYFATASNTIYKRPVDLPIENDMKELVVVARGNISGLAYDAASKNNLFWSESGGKVYVINLEDMVSSEVRLKDVTVENVRDITVLLSESRLAMLTRKAGNVYIQTTTMDGNDNQNVVSSSRDISAYAFDMEKKLFYYVIGTTVYSVSRDGSNRTIVFSGIDSNVFRLVIYKNYITWFFTHSAYSHLMRTYDIVTKTSIALGYFDNSVLVDMNVLDTTLQTVKFIDPCAYENGNCSQICITKYVSDVMTATCECGLGYKLSPDKKSCFSTVVDDFFLVVADWTNEQMQQINIENNEINVVPDNGASEYMGVYFDPDKKKLIFAEYLDTEILIMNLNGTDRRVLSDLGYAGYAYRFDKDLTTKNLYFTSYLDSFIGAVTPSGDYLILKKDFSYYESINSVVVHPGKGWMYYTVSHYLAPYVGRSDMDGDNSVRLISGDHVDTPDGLAIDYTKGHLYWSDAKFDTITRCDLEGRNCATIINMTGTYRSEEIRDMVIDGNFLYYSSYKKDHVIRVDISNATGTFPRIPVGQNPGLGKLDTMTYYNSRNTNVQPASPRCRDRHGLGDCSTICLPTPTGRTCECERGISLKPDGRTCANVYQCTDVIKQQVTLVTSEQEMIAVTFKESCLRHLNDKCDYICPTNYRPLFKTVLTCTKVGWNLEPETLCQEIRCPATIKNGLISKSCKREIGEKCDYTCTEGFMKSEKKAVCTSEGNGMYHVPDDDLCTPFRCNSTIDNGDLDTDCSRDIGSSCKYTCKKYFTPSNKKAMAVCQAGGWNPTSPCVEKECGSLAFGKVTGSCMQRVGEACTFQCNQGYMNATSLAVCKNDYKWHPEKSCIPARCSSFISNGDIDVTGSCDLSIGSICRYICIRGFAAANLRAKLMCKSNGEWNVTDGLCSEVSIGPQKQSQKESSTTTGFTVGIVIMVLIVIALVVLIIFLFRRNRDKASSNYATASFHQNGGGGGIAIENPGYLQSSSQPTIEVKDEHPYSSVDPSQMQPVTFAQAETAADDGIVNPLYDKEPLPDVSHVDMNQDKAVLTYESWMKERGKNK